jgi:uncharacterized protein YjeT (DUF2065 family)
MWHDLWVAMALLLVIEGILPFLNPRGFKEALLMVSRADDRTLRFGGLFTMLAGVGLLYLIN